MKPRVALESTIYAFGLPEPEALALGRSLNSIIEEKGAQAVPIAILEGVPQIGFDENVLQAVCRGKGFVKVNSRDLGAIKALKGNNYQDGDILKISNIPPYNTNKMLKIRINNDVLDKYTPAIFNVTKRIM